MPCESECKSRGCNGCPNTPIEERLIGGKDLFTVDGHICPFNEVLVIRGDVYDAVVHSDSTVSIVSKSAEVDGHQWGCRITFKPETDDASSADVGGISTIESFALRMLSRLSG